MADITQQLIGSKLYPRTAAEISAGVTPVDFAMPPGKPERFGATGTGSSDDSTAVRNEALAVMAGDPSLRLTSRRFYNLASWSALNTTGPLRIEARGATVVGPATPAVFARPSTVVELSGGHYEDFTGLLHRNVATESGAVDGLRVADVSTDAIAGSGVFLSVPTTRYRVQGCDFANHTAGYPVVIGRNIAAEQDTWSKGWVWQNTFTGIAAVGDLNGVLLYGYDTGIIGNYLDDLSNSGGELAGIYTKCRANTVAFNVVRNLMAAGATSQGINIKGSVKGETSTPQGYATRVIGNHVENVVANGGANGGYHIRLQIDETLAIGNTVYDPVGGSALIVDGAGTPGSNVIVANNIARHDDNVAVSVGVRVSAETDRVLVAGNVLDGFGAGVRVASVNPAQRVLAINNNLIKGFGSGSVGVVVRRDDAISRLDVINNHVDAAQNGISFPASGTGTLADVRILDNNFENCTVPINGILPADIQIRHCHKVATSGATTLTALALELPDDSAFAVELRAVAVLAGGGNRAMYHREALVYRNGGDATLQGAVQDIGTPQESDSNWNATIDTSGNFVRVRVTGGASQDVSWKLEVNVIGMG